MSYEIRAMSFGEILDMGFRLLRDHFLLLVGIAAVFYLPFGLLAGGVASALVAGGAGAVPGPGALVALAAAALVAVTVVNPIVLAGVTHAVGESYLGSPATLGSALRVGFSILLPLLGTSALALLVELAGFGVPLGAGGLLLALLLPQLGPFALAAAIAALVLLALPGVALVLAFLILQQVVVLERRFGAAALRRSRELMRGQKLRGLGLALVATLLTSVLTAGVGLLGLLLPAALGPVLEALVQSVGYAFLSTVLVIFYFDIRCRSEAFDLEHLARLVEGHGAAVPAAIS